MKRSGGRETWHRLQGWDREQAASERLGAHLLRSDGYLSIDPSHPLGGKDGVKDILCKKDGLIFVGACYFPRGQHTFNAIKTKFTNDLQGVAKNHASGILFITNQEVTVKERDELRKIALKQGVRSVEIYHLERIASILDEPLNYGIRLEYLDIDMTKEDQVAFFARQAKHDSQRQILDQIPLLPIADRDYVSEIMLQRHRRSELQRQQSIFPVSPRWLQVESRLAGLQQLETTVRLLTILKDLPQALSDSLTNYDYELERLNRLRYSDESIKCLPFGYVSIISAFFRLLYANLIDGNEKFRQNLESRTELKMDIKSLMKLQKSSVSIGEYLSLLLPADNLHSIGATMTNVIGFNFIGRVKDKFGEDYEQYSYMAYQSQSPANDLIADLERLYQLRDTLTDDFYATSEADYAWMYGRCAVTAATFMSVSEEIVNEILEAENH